MKNPLVVIAVVLVLVLAGCSKPPGLKPEAPPIKVTAVKAERGDLVRKLEASGPLQFIANTTVSAEVAAQVKSIRVSDGQAVQQGELLLIFNETKIKETAIHAASTLEKDQATLAFNKTDHEKNVTLLKTGAVSQTAYEKTLSAYQNSQAQVEMDRAILAKAMEDLKNTRVKAPITGRISKRYVEMGDWVEEGGKLFQISDYRTIYLQAHLSDLDLARLDVKKILGEGISAEVLVDSYPGKVFPGKLAYVEPVAGAARLFEIRIFMDNKEMLLLQGMLGRARIPFDNAKGVLRIPLTALLDPVRKDHQNTVFVLDAENRAQFKTIKLGKFNRTHAEITDGLNEGDLVIVSGKEVLTSGQRVELVESR